jgi:hypothetical protein
MRNNEKEMEMTKFRDYAETVASQMKKGLSNERSKIAEIGRVLREFGESPTVVNYHLNVDEDFIPDVLQYYKGVEKRKPVSSNNNLNPWINHSK